MKKNFCVLCFCSALFLSNAVAQIEIKSSDLKILSGEKWVGKLTYLDYSSNKKTSILADLIVEPTGDSLVWIFKNIYPKEPKANGESKIKISKKGKIFDGEKVIERAQLSPETLKIVTTKSKDKKQFRYTYIIATEKFSIRKEEKGINDKDFFERNVYEYSRPVK
jgi:hypothetical protein